MALEPGRSTFYRRNHSARVRVRNRGLAICPLIRADLGLGSVSVVTVLYERLWLLFAALAGAVACLLTWTVCASASTPVTMQRPRKRLMLAGATRRTRAP